MVIPEDPGTEHLAMQLATIPIPAARAGHYATGGAWGTEEQGTPVGLIVSGCGRSTRRRNPSAFPATARPS